LRQCGIIIDVILCLIRMITTSNTDTDTKTNNNAKQAAN